MNLPRQRRWSPGRTPWFIAVAVALYLRAPPAALASPTAERSTDVAAGTKVVVLADLDADIPAATQSDFEQAAVRGLRRGGFEVVTTARRIGAQACASAECIRQAIGTSAADHVVRLVVGVARRDYDVAIELYAGGTGELLAQTAERCELCGVVEAMDLIDAHAAVMRQRLEANRQIQPARLDLRSRPPGATLWIDGANVGRAPLQLEVSPGSHRVRAELERHRPSLRQVVAVAGVDEVVEFQLAPLPKVRSPMTTAGWALVGVGAAVLVVGTVLLAVDGRPNRAVCRGDNVDPRGNCRYIFDSTVVGGAVLGAGLASLGGGVGLVVGASRRAKRRAGGSPISVRMLPMSPAPAPRATSP